MPTKGTLEWAIKNINFCKGCTNDCRYCYSKAMANRYGWKKSDEWHIMENIEKKGKIKYRKVNGIIMSPSSHDIFPENLELAIKVYKNLLKSNNKLLIVTKPRFIVIQRLVKELFYYRRNIEFRFTITTIDDDIRKEWETNASTIPERLRCIRMVKNSFRHSVSVEPFLDDDPIPLIVLLLKISNNMDIWLGPMNLIHVEKKYQTKEVKKRYSKQNLLDIRHKISNLRLISNIRYKDGFINIIKK